MPSAGAASHRKQDRREITQLKCVCIKGSVFMKFAIQNLSRRARVALIGISICVVQSAVLAQAQSPSAALKIDELNTTLQSPWALAFLPDGRMLVTEKSGTLKVLAATGQTLGTLGGVPLVNSAGQGGLLDVVVDPAYASNQRIYLSFSENDSNNPRFIIEARISHSGS